MAIYKCGRGFELGRSVKQIQLVARAGLEPGTAGLRVLRADHSATLPPCFDIILVSDQIYEVLSGLVSRWPIQACTRYALWEARWQNTWRADHLDQGVRAPSPRHNMSFILPVIGRGIAVNDKDGGNGRLGCATITADSSLFVEKSLEYKTENDFSR